jgi:dihydrofolate synthase / folylpolyglutamate synthase
MCQDASSRFDFPESPLIAPATDTERWLYGLTRFGMKPGLRNIEALVTRFGRPDRPLKFLHVAGTNGKGSVCHMLEAQLRAAGYRTGLFTSPHLLHVGERLRVDGLPLGDADVAALVEQVAPAVSELEATFFETLTLMALLHFAEREVDWVLWETGLGGRLDCTRVVDAEASLLTGVSLDHTKYLGDTIEAIARDKLGIGRPGKPFYSALVDPGLRALAVEEAAASGFDLVERDRALDWRLEEEELLIADGPLAGRYPLPGLPEVQAGNAALALLALMDLGRRREERLLPEDPASALIDTELQGRFHRVRETPPLVVDGAHNPEALAGALKAWLSLLEREGIPAAEAPVLFGCMADKEVSPMLELLAGQPCPVILTAARQPRAMPAGELAARAGSAAESWIDAHELAAALTEHGGGPLLVTGSFYLAAEAYLALGD